VSQWLGLQGLWDSTTSCGAHVSFHRLHGARSLWWSRWVTGRPPGSEGPIGATVHWQDHMGHLLVSTGCKGDFTGWQPTHSGWADKLLTRVTGRQIGLLVCFSGTQWSKLWEKVAQLLCGTVGGWAELLGCFLGPRVGGSHYFYVSPHEIVGKQLHTKLIYRMWSALFKM
jgi:hypothetical protein